MEDYFAKAIAEIEGVGNADLQKALNRLQQDVGFDRVWLINNNLDRMLWS